MKYSNPNIFLLVILFLVNGIHIVNGQNSKNDARMLLKAEDFQKNINGKNVNLYFLKNGNMNMAITNYGARIVSLCVPDKYGQMADVVVGFKSIDDYLNKVDAVKNYTLKLIRK